MTQCKFCGSPIRWDTATGKPIPFNLDGSRHDCRSQKVDQPSNPNNSKLDRAVEVRIREIAKEEIVKFLTKALTG